LGIRKGDAHDLLHVTGSSTALAQKGLERREDGRLEDRVEGMPVLADLAEYAKKREHVFAREAVQRIDDPAGRATAIPVHIGAVGHFFGEQQGACEQ